MSQKPAFKCTECTKLIGHDDRTWLNGTPHCKSCAGKIRARRRDQAPDWDELLRALTGMVENHCDRGEGLLLPLSSDDERALGVLERAEVIQPVRDGYRRMGSSAGVHTGRRGDLG
jgi:hypothetical protein